MDLARPLPSQGQALADEGRQRLLEVAGSDALQVEDGDQHLKAVRSPRVSRQDRRRVPNARALGSFAVAHTRLANRDRADAGHDLAFRKMAVAHDALLARLGLEIGMLCEKLSNLRFDGLGQQRTRAAAQDLCEGISKGPWLGELDDVTFQHGVSLLYWRSGGVEHHHDTPPYPVTPSPTSGHSSRTAFEDCCLARGSLTIIRCTRTAGNIWKNCGPETDARCHLTSRRRFFARSTGLIWFYARSARSKLNAMKCCGRRKRALRLHYLCGSRALARSSLPCSTLRVCSGTSRTDGSWQPMQAWLPAHGKVVASTTSRVSRRQAIHVCARQWSSLPGCG